MMRLFAICIAAVHGLLAVGALAIIQAVVRAFAPAWSLPFSVWWGLVLCLPGIAFTFLISRSGRPF